MLPQFSSDIIFFEPIANAIIWNDDTNTFELVAPFRDRPSAAVFKLIVFSHDSKIKNEQVSCAWIFISSDNPAHSAHFVFIPSQSQKLFAVLPYQIQQHRN